MTSDITVKGKAYALVYSDKAGSLRRSTTDGATLPHTIRIAHTDAVDSATKIATRRSLLRVDMTHLDTGGVNPSPLPVSVQVVVVKGKGSYSPSSTAILLALDSAIQFLSTTAADGSALGLRSTYSVNEEQ